MRPWFQEGPVILRENDRTVDCLIWSEAQTLRVSSRYLYFSSVCFTLYFFTMKFHRVAKFSCCLVNIYFPPLLIFVCRSCFHSTNFIANSVINDTKLYCNFYLNYRHLSTQKYAPSMFLGVLICHWKVLQASSSREHLDELSYERKLPRWTYYILKKPTASSQKKQTGQISHNTRRLCHTT